MKNICSRQWLLKPAIIVQNRLPAWFFARSMKIGIDASLTAVAMYVAYQLRFDAAVPAADRKTMYLWMLLLPVLRPALMWVAGAYEITWRYFSFQDAIGLAFGALSSSAVLLVLRLFLSRVPRAANPISVIVIEAAVFLLLASAVRALRRLATEEALLSTAQGSRLILVGNEKALAAALHQMSSYRNTRVAGLLMPSGNRLAGKKFCGSPILGEPAGLERLLRERKADLVIVTDARLDSLGDVVSVATNYGVEVRLLPSAADVLRGDVSIAAPRRLSERLERVLVVGGAGYLGSVLVPMLLDRGYKVRVLDRLLFGSEPLAHVSSHPNFDLRVGDVRDIQAVVSAVKGCDAVIDLAALVGDPACAVNKALSLEINRAATRIVIEICKGYAVSRLIFASTCSVYGASDYLVDELTPTAPISVYAETKVDSEQLLLETTAPDFHPVILRLGTLFGLSPRPRFDLLVNLLTARAATTGGITIFNGEQWRPFLHVNDAAKAFVGALEASAEIVSGEVFNVGDYRMNLRLSSVSEKIAEIVSTVLVDHVTNGDKRNYRASFDKIHTRLGFRCERTIESGIREIFEAIRSGQIVDYAAPRFNNHLVTQTFALSDSASQSSMRALAKLVA